MSHAARAFSPLDSELELLSGRLSPNLAEAVTRLGLSMPFRVSTEILSALTGVRLTESMIRRVTLKSGRILVALEEKAVELLEKEAPTVEASAPRLQLSVDGAMVPSLGRSSNAGGRRTGLRGLAAACGYPQLLLADV